MAKNDAMTEFKTESAESKGLRLDLILNCILFRIFITAIHQEQVFKYLDEQERAKEEATFIEQLDINKTLTEQASQPKNNAVGKGSLDLEHCGSSSIQRFGGEDRGYDERKKMQQQQLRQWCSQGIQERENKIVEEQQKQNEYSKYVMDEDKLRCQMAKEEQGHRQEVENMVQMENRRLAEERQGRQRETQEKERLLEDSETRHVITSPFFCEETDYAQSVVSEHRVRPDHFKGFTTERMNSIIEANDSVVAEKEALRREEDMIEQGWAAKQSEMVLRMEEVEKKKRQLVAEENKIQADTLKTQREELKQKQIKMEQDRFGSIGNGFFQKFGTSCR